MAEVEEPQFTSLSQRIAALNQQGVGKSLVVAPQKPAKRPPPALPNASNGTGNRPALPSRPQSTNNPPISTYGSSVTKQANNQPIGVKTTSLLPPPPVDRDQPANTNNARTPPLPARRGPPPLPSRKDSSQPSPALPPRKSSTQMVRRGSNESTRSYSSTISGMSLGQSTTASSVDSARKLPPALDQAKLPALPPSRREREQKDAEERANPPKMPLVSMKSSPNIPIRQAPVVDRDLAPKMPPRPTGPPKMPPRPVNGNSIQEDDAPTQRPRRLPPPGATKSVLSMGFGNSSKETPNPGLRPVPTFSKPAPGPLVQELNERNFDSVIMTGKASFVDFYAPYCKYCVELEPIWKQLAEDFSFATDKLIFAKIDVDKYKNFMSRFNIQEYPTMLFFDGRSETPQKCQFTTEAWYLKQFVEEKSGISAADAPKSIGSGGGAPPAINMSSKPSRNLVQAIQSRPPPPSAPSSGCLICRDFSGPDSVAAQHPRHSLPRTGDVTGYLADVLCGSFTSATDKARAIFTWLHHNIAYDTGAFFEKRVKHVEPKDTVATGLAVCGGYAGLFAAIALKANLEAVMVTGHGKGYGYTPVKPGEQVPPCDPSGHAWNAVRIDGGEWKLLDPCWGAGNVGNQVYNKKFTPAEFTMSNEDFGIKHFPQDRGYFFREDGRVPSWEEYYLGPCGAEPLDIYGSASDNGLSAASFSPPQKHIPVNGEVVRFQFSKICEHWDFEKNGQGKQYPMVLNIKGRDGRKEDYVAFENNEFWYWADVPAADLGAPGMKVSVYTVTTVNGK
ncbi:Protein disulfide-isomerase tigA, partial [Lachnellula suecica]